MGPVVSGALLTIPEVAELLGRSQGFVRGLIRDGILEARTQRGRWYVPRRAVDEWLAPAEPARPAPAFARRVEVRRRG